MFCTLSNKCERALSIVRIMLGIIFIAHGAQKVLALFGGPGLEGFVQWSATIGIPSWLAYIAAFSELIAGISLLLGLASELGAILAIALMAGAIYFVHFKSGFFAQNGGYEYALSLLVFSLAILVGGPGDWYLWCSCKTRGCKCTKK